MLVIPGFVIVAAQPDPDRFDLQRRQTKGMQQVEFVLHAQRHDVDDADAQGPDVLALGQFRLDPGNPVALNGADLVISAGQYQRHWLS